MFFKWDLQLANKTVCPKQKTVLCFCVVNQTAMVFHLDFTWDIDHKQNKDYTKGSVWFTTVANIETSGVNGLPLCLFCSAGLPTAEQQLQVCLSLLSLYTKERGRARWRRRRADEVGKYICKRQSTSISSSRSGRRSLISDAWTIDLGVSNWLIELLHA